MSTKKNNPAAEAAEVLEAQEKVIKTCPCVYCGPSVRGIAHQFTVYPNGELPETLREFMKEHPAAAGLVVDIDRFAEVRRRIETPGTAEYILSNKIKSEL